MAAEVGAVGGPVKPQAVTATAGPSIPAESGTAPRASNRRRSTGPGKRRPLGGEAEEAAVIFRVADQHQPLVGHLGKRALHQQPPDPVALPLGRDRDRPHHHQRVHHSVIAGQRHRPALDRADQRAALDRREAQPPDRARGPAHLVRRPRMTIHAERAVEQRFDCGGIHGGEGDEIDQTGTFAQRRRALPSHRPNASGTVAMKLYDAAWAPSPRRVRIYLAEKGIAVERVSVDLRRDEQLADPYLRINPRGAVPALEFDDGEVICESAAICRYF